MGVKVEAFEKYRLAYEWRQEQVAQPSASYLESEMARSRDFALFVANGYFANVEAAWKVYQRCR